MGVIVRSFKEAGENDRQRKQQTLAREQLVEKTRHFKETQKQDAANHRNIYHERDLLRHQQTLNRGRKERCDFLEAQRKLFLRAHRRTMVDVIKDNRSNDVCDDVADFTLLMDTHARTSRARRLRTRDSQKLENLILGNANIEKTGRSGTVIAASRASPGVTSQVTSSSRCDVTRDSTGNLPDICNRTDSRPSYADTYERVTLSTCSQNLTLKGIPGSRISRNRERKQAVSGILDNTDFDRKKRSLPYLLALDEGEVAMYQTVQRKAHAQRRYLTQVQNYSQTRKLAENWCKSL